MAGQLTTGAIERICSGNGSDINSHDPPILQILNIKKVVGPGGGGSTDRYRIILSDGKHLSQGMLATQNNHLITNGTLTELCLVKVQKALPNNVQGRIVIILLQVELLRTYHEKIGSPTDVPVGSKNENNQTAANNSNTAAPSMMQPNAVTPANRSMYNNGGGYGNNAGGPHKVENSNGMSPYNNRPKTAGQNPYSQSGSGGIGGGLVGSGPVARNMGAAPGQHFTPIASLNPYANRWVIKARVTNKSDIKTWSNARGEGSLFSVDLLDSSNMDIRATFFKEAVDKFYNMLEMDQVYTFSGGRIKAANMQYNTCKSNHELSFDQNAEIHKVNDGGNDIAKQTFDDRKIIADLANTEPNTFVDIIGIVKSASECQSLVSRKTQKELFKSDLVVVDESCAEVNVTLWGDKAKTASQVYAGQPVVGFKKLKLGDYGGRSCSVSGGPVMINPDVPETQMLLNWWRSQGHSTATTSLSGGGMGPSRMDPLEQRKVLRDIKGEHMGYNEKPDYICVKGQFTYFRLREEGPWYTACANPDPPCNNRCKATITADQQWHCERCGQTRDACTRRYILSACIADDTCTTWVSLFNEQVLEVIGKDNTADLLYDRYFNDHGTGEMPPMEDFQQIFKNAEYHDWVFKLKVKNEDVGGESRLKTTIYSMAPIDYVQESKDLLKAIANLQ